MQGASTPYYLDWTFWAFVASAIAIALSQVPPLKDWFRPPKLVVETPKKFRLTHIVGYPTAGVILNIRNTGGRSTRITAINLEIRRSGKHLIELPVTEFFPDQTNNQTLMFMPLTLASGAEATLSVNAYLDLTREKTRELNLLSSAVKREGYRPTPGYAGPAPISPTLVEQGVKLFQQNFQWMAGEYELRINIATEENCSVKQAPKQFTLWESDEAELRAFTDEYKFGIGIGIPNQKQATGVFVTLRA
ncbi:hypothetical protein H6CHR_03189 [Variovorax sp. PBL-H6]|uniref:hypothetical protein n=1 Tax=Variovorax sp. PBL-H6 TaxID=434009 RepID=UPI001316EDF3|nr:hypothetical protein [Variovorax sp. PBL-H6]VTU29410.1 hypothetical protein H6CHR_03189 [Variovorax sp. PBL-H6]